MFLQVLNNYHPTIQFTHTLNKNEIAFLDTIVYRSPTHRIYIRIYHKPTDLKQYLHHHSANPRSEKESVPYGLLIRCKRICTEDYYFEEEAKKIYNQLKYRKYPTKMDILTLLKPSLRYHRITSDSSPTATHETPTYSRYLKNLKDCY